MKSSLFKALMLAVLAALVYASCDSIDVSDVPPAGSQEAQAPIIATVKAYYEDAIQQPEIYSLGKTGSDSTTQAVLAEMVRQYPPDWSTAVSWRGKDRQHFVTVLRGTDKPATSFSHDSIAVLRTLVAELGADREVRDARLVEFASSRALNISRFDAYVKHWLDQNLAPLRRRLVLVAEYTLGYVGEQAYVYTQADSVRVPVSLSLKQTVGLARFWMIRCTAGWSRLSSLRSVSGKRAAMK